MRRRHHGVLSMASSFVQRGFASFSRGDVLALEVVPELPARVLILLPVANPAPEHQQHQGREACHSDDDYLHFVQTSTSA